MDGIIVTAVIVLAVIAVIEAVSLFCKPHSIKAEHIFAVTVPVFPETENIYGRMEYIAGELAGFHCGKIRIIIVNYGISAAQLEDCRAFCFDYPSSVITDPAGVEKILSKTFAISSKT